jgi:hypothetical protein
MAREPRRGGTCDLREGTMQRLGPPDASARPFDRFVRSFTLAFAGASVCTAGVALWLLWVCAAILPARDPSHVPLWRAVAASYLAYSGLSWVVLRRGPRAEVLLGLVVAISVVAIGAGLYGIGHLLDVARTGGHFEGYLVLMGVLLAGHGLAAIGFALVTAKASRSATR